MVCRVCRAAAAVAVPSGSPFRGISSFLTAFFRFLLLFCPLYYYRRLFIVVFVVGVEF